ncbi:MAG: hemerythrin domain-containing protein [Burkholderiales bacterium]
MNKAIRKLREEHRSISAVVHALEQLAHAAQDASVRPGFEVFRAMLYYIDAFPERQHHPKEDEHLFARLRLRAPQAGPMLDGLHAEHARCAGLIRDLEQALLAFEQSWPNGAAEFAAVVDEYARFHRAHMRKEEHDVLPLAEKTLRPEDWDAIEQAFAANTDPFSDPQYHTDFSKLYARIVELAPDPIGFGAPWKKAGA